MKICTKKKAEFQIPTPIKLMGWFNIFRAIFGAKFSAKNHVDEFDCCFFVSFCEYINLLWKL